MIQDGSLDVAAMRAAAAALLGEHDFRHFCKARGTGRPSGAASYYVAAANISGDALESDSKGLLAVQTYRRTSVYVRNVSCSGAQVDISKPPSYRRKILEADVLELPCSGSEGGRRSALALHLRGTAFLWHQVSLCPVRTRLTTP